MIDTLLVCSCTALTILVTDVWQETDLDGVTLTAAAFEQAVPDAGAYLLLVMVFFLGFSTILAMWYYGSKCLGFLVGAEYQRHYIWFYLMLLLAPRVNAEAQRYFAEKHHLASELISGSR